VIWSWQKAKVAQPHQSLLYTWCKKSKNR